MLIKVSTIDLFLFVFILFCICNDMDIFLDNDIYYILTVFELHLLVRDLVVR
jgi:hypothetical protein